MRAIVAMTALLLLCACAGRESSPVMLCTEPRPQVCTQEYNPVCGQLAAGGWHEYSSPCNACAHDAVAGYETGPCPDAP